MKSQISSFGLLAIVLFSLPAWSTDGVIPAPQGLSVCAAESQQLIAMRRIAAQFGTLVGCFVSHDQAPVNGVDKPVESAFALTLFQSESEPFTEASVDQLYAATKRQWENVKPLWDTDKAAYEQRIRELVRETSPSTSAKTTMSIEQPVLVSMQRINPGSYTVVSIRPRRISKDGLTFSFNTAEGNALILNEGKLIRLTIQRQLRGQGDVDAVKSGITGWAQDTSKALLKN